MSFHAEVESKCELTQIEDALACLAEEGRARPRKSSGSCHEAVIRWCPNGVIPTVEIRWTLIFISKG
jgi:hypothetical protein